MASKCWRTVLVAKPRQPHFRIVKWNHRVKEKLLHHNFCLSPTVLVVFDVQQCAWAKHTKPFFDLKHLAFLLLSCHQATRCYRQIMVRSVGSGLQPRSFCFNRHVFARENFLFSKFLVWLKFLLAS